MGFRLVIRSAAQVVTLCRNNELVLKGEAMQNVVVVEPTQPGTGVSVVVNGEGTIECIDEDRVVLEKYADCHFDSDIDACGMCIIPGEGYSYFVAAR